MQADNLFTEGKTDTGTVILSGEERHEDTFRHFRQHTFSVIADFENDFLCFCACQLYQLTVSGNIRYLQVESHAKAMLRSLSIAYNRVRQAAITQEITEVIAGAKAKE